MKRIETPLSGLCFRSDSHRRPFRFAGVAGAYPPLGYCPRVSNAEREDEHGGEHQVTPLELFRLQVRHPELAA
jgi:hypothetical protein